MHLPSFFFHPFIQISLKQKWLLFALPNKESTCEKITPEYHFDANHKYELCIVGYIRRVPAYEVHNEKKSLRARPVLIKMWKFLITFARVVPLFFTIHWIICLFWLLGSRAAKLQLIAPHQIFFFMYNLNKSANFCHLFPLFKCWIVAVSVAWLEAARSHLSKLKQLQVNSCSHSDYLFSFAASNPPHFNHLQLTFFHLQHTLLGQHEKQK